ncbi:MAG TPA: allantoinase AllB [Phycisphaerae bacterium]|nr:allantoinase AllB [Phycisphaerae bacterium]
MLDLLIKNATVVRDAAERLDLGIAGGRFAEIAPDIATPAKETLDAAGLHAFPALIDSHVHFNDAGDSPSSRAHWEGIATGSAALAAGGGTLYFDMPLNSSPPTLTPEAFDAKRAAAEKASLTDFALWGGLTPGNLDQLEALADRGVVGFKAFMSDSGMHDFPRADDLTLYRGMKIARRLGLPVAVHAESEEITVRLAAEAAAGNRQAVRDYLEARPILAEVEATARAITLAEETGCKLHIVHVANSRSVEFVRRAAANGWADVTCETCPHYLALSGDDVERIGAAAKCAPPLRTPADIDELWNDLAAGKFAFVASDHSPAPPEMKTATNFFEVWGGISGVQSTLPILLSRGPALPLPLIARLTAGNVAARYRIPHKGAVAVGNDADVALIDIHACYELTPEMLLDRHKQSPYVGRCFHGRIARTLLRGSTIFRDGRTTGSPIGRFVRPARH